jgi:hypothetical protein
MIGQMYLDAMVMDWARFDDRTVQSEEKATAVPSTHFAAVRSLRMTRTKELDVYADLCATASNVWKWGALSSL